MPDEQNNNEQPIEVVGNDETTVTPNLDLSSNAATDGVIQELVTDINQSVDLAPVDLNPATDQIIPTVVAPIAIAPVMAEPISNQIQPVVVKSKFAFFKQKKVMFGLIALAIVLVGGASAYAATSWYQNPKKVLADSIINAATSRSSIYSADIVYEGYGTKLSIDIETKTADLSTGSIDVGVLLTYGDKNYSIETSALIDKDSDLYIKLSSISSAIDEAKKSFGISATSTISRSIDKLVDKIEGTWIRISSNDIKTYSPSYAESKNCIDDELSKLKDDNSAINEISNIYRDNAFVITDKELGQKDGSFGYEVKLSTPIAKTFVTNLKQTKTYKSLVECDDSLAFDESDMAEDISDVDGNATLSFWVDSWSHQLTKIESDVTMGESTLKATIVPQFNKKFTIDTPESSITLTQLQTYFDDIYKAMYEQSRSSYYYYGDI